MDFKPSLVIVGNGVRSSSRVWYCRYQLGGCGRESWGTYKVEDAGQWIHILHNALLTLILDDFAAVAQVDEALLLENLHDFGIEDVLSSAVEV